MTAALVDGVIRLSGRCRVEEAEQILSWVSEDLRTVDICECEHMHAAVFQILLAAGPDIVGNPGGFVEQWLLPRLGIAEPSGEAQE